MFTQNLTSGIVGYETDENGLLSRGRINAVPTTGLDTTASLYAPGCVIVDSSTGLAWYNKGTAAAPSWIVGAPGEAQVQVSVAAASIPLLFGGTNVRLLPPPPGGTAQAYVVQGMMLEYIGAGTSAFAGGGTTVRVVYGSAGTNVAVYGNIGTATFFGTATKYLQFAPTQVSTGQTVVPGMGLYLDNTTAAYTGGTSSLKVNLWYSTVNV